MRLRVSVTELPHACPEEGIKSLGWGRQSLLGLSLRISFFLWAHFPVVSKGSRTPGTLHMFLCPPSDCSATRKLCPRKVLAGAE